MLARFHPSGITLLVLSAFVLAIPSCLWGQQNQQEPPPANVTVAMAKSGVVAPQAEFIATVFYQEISDTAAEKMGFQKFDRVDNALQALTRRYGADSTVNVLTHGGETYPQLAR